MPERHHWWPQCVSKFWEDEDGCIHRLSQDGKLVKTRPKNIAVIGNAHQIKLAVSGYDDKFIGESFETEFQRADDNFPSIIEWLNGLDRLPENDNHQLEKRILPQPSTDEKIALLIEGIVSLAVRSPKNRESAISLAEHFRGPLPGPERNNLIGLNMRNTHRRAVESIGTSGKFLVIFSSKREFIFGDGFFHNLSSPTAQFYNTKILVPLTPWLSILFVRPMKYSVMPRLSSVAITEKETDLLNHTVQVYAKNEIFFRSQKPKIANEYFIGKHLRYADPDNPIEELIHKIPGIPPRDKSLDLLRQLSRRKD